MDKYQKKCPVFLCLCVCGRPWLKSFFFIEIEFDDDDWEKKSKQISEWEKKIHVQTEFRHFGTPHVYLCVCVLWHNQKKKIGKKITTKWTCSCQLSNETKKKVLWCVFVCVNKSNYTNKLFLPKRVNVSYFQTIDTAATVIDIGICDQCQFFYFSFSFQESGINRFI